MSEPKNRITRDDLAKSLAADFGLTQAKCHDIIANLFHTIGTHVLDGGVVTLRGVGRFQLRTTGGFERAGNQKVRRLSRVAFIPGVPFRMEAE